MSILLPFASVVLGYSFVNSQEWTVSRSVPDLRLGIVGSLSSGKSALVHRYLTGSYMQEESPEGGRFKKEVLMDGHSHLLLIRDEGGPPELQDYMEDVHGKEIPLQYVTVKVPGQKPRGSKTITHSNGSSDALSSITNTDGYEFLIVSLDNKQWHFEAGSCEERDEWVTAIENQILNTLQSVESSKGKLRLNSSVEAASIQSIRNRVQGNGYCADCDAPNPDWASLNLGILLCIECSGIHRNLGSHISKVRSLHLDEWPAGHLSVMLSIGNRLANSIWEGDLKGRRKPIPTSNREEKERWASAKYVTKEFLTPLDSPTHLSHQLFEAVTRNDMKGVIDSLIRGEPDIINTPLSPQDSRTPLHLACFSGNLAIAQLLLWYNADVSTLDNEGRSCLSLARGAARGQTEGAGASSLVDLLLSVGCHDQTVNTTVTTNTTTTTVI
ncbi:unnamed protein product [Nesidiocoris tenuis]|uniref:Uncharacterized protein n=1 Tax=Nesidiocoris tenuis TaxID=355587 RepID=A0A6H5H1S2_9HEMI|nr:unnamed protein product [Nesidiocoris tenuis]